MGTIRTYGIPPEENPLAYNSSPFDMMIVMDRGVHIIPMPHVPKDEVAGMIADWKEYDYKPVSNHAGFWDVWIAHKKDDVTVPTSIVRVPRLVRD